LLPVDQVDALLEIANLAHARESGWISRAGQVTAQADVSMRADIARSTFGFDGTGITIGILSDSFDTRADPITTMAQDIASGDLPADTVSWRTTRTERMKAARLRRSSMTSRRARRSCSPPPIPDRPTLPTTSSRSPMPARR
jgi:hypothetical protein